MSNRFMRSLRGVAILSFCSFFLVLGCTEGPLAPGLQTLTQASDPDVGAALRITVSPSTVDLDLLEPIRFTAEVRDGQGNLISDPDLRWSSSDASIVGIDPAVGAARAFAVGSVTITASVGSASGTSTANVLGAASRTVKAHHGSGQSAPAGTLLPKVIVAQVLDAAGDPLPGVAVVWTVVSGGGSVSKSSVTTNHNGAATTRWTLGPLVGTQELKAVSGGASATFTATALGDGSIQVVVTPAAATVGPSGSQQFVATVLDADGNPVNGAPVTWSSSNPSVATVDAAGLATGWVAGTATITASSSGQSASSTLTVSGSTPPPPPSGPSILPELPRVYVNTAYQAPAGNRIRVRQGDDLQNAIDQAQRGDIIEIDPGATFTGNFRLRPKPGSGPVVITTNTTLPPQGTRVSPASAGNFAIIESTNLMPAIDVQVGASDYRIMGVRVRQRPGSGGAYSIVRVGRSNQTQTTVSQVPHRIIFDRVYVHSNPGQDVRRCILLNGAHTAVVDSYLSGCNHTGAESQAIIAWNTPGPLKIVNNYLEASGENVMFGGADPKIPNVVPSDMEIRHNHFKKLVSWKGGPYVIKNLIEFKLGRRVLVEGNVFENNWMAAQNGHAVVIKSANQSGSAPWSVTEHVTFRYNVIRNSSEGFNLFRGTPNSLPANTILIAHNVMDKLGPASAFGGTGMILQIVGGVDDLTVEHNTFIGNRLTGFTGSKGQVDRFTFRNNVVSGGRYGLAGDGQREGISTLNAFATGGWSMEGNVVIGRSPSHYPANNHFPVDAAAVGFQNYVSGAYQLSASSPYKGILSGVDPGADIARVNAETRNVN
jgi:hypothetical protein